MMPEVESNIRRTLGEIAKVLAAAARADPRADLVSVLDEVERRLFLLRRSINADDPKTLDITFESDSIWGLRAALRNLKQQYQRQMETVILFSSWANIQPQRDVLEALSKEMGVAIVVMPDPWSAEP